MQDRDVSTDILQLIQFVGSHDHGKSALFHLLPEEILHYIRGDRIQSVKHLVAQQIFRPGTKREDQKSLPLHPLGKCPQRLPHVQIQRFCHIAYSLCIHFGILALIELRHLLH